MSNRKFCKSIFAFAAVFFITLSATRSSCQTVTGTILGTVKDQQGAVVPNAAISAKELGTGSERTAVSDSSGTFTIVSVPAGPYEVTVTAPGFQTEIRRDIAVTVGGSLRLDFTLVVGTVSQTVEVTGEAPQVDTTSSTMSGLVAENSVRELPLNGRDWLQLAELQPGVQIAAVTPSSRVIPSIGLGPRIAISGGRPTENVYRIDGMIVNDVSNSSPGSALGVNLGVDAIREFSVLTNTYSAEYGMSSGGVINAITKSGANSIHGTAFYFIRNSALDARNFFDPAKIPPFRRNQFGGSAGGAIKKDKLFYFANYEGLRQFLTESFSNNTLSPNARQGILANGTTVTVSPLIAPYLALYPLPNGPITGDTGKIIIGGGQIGVEDYAFGRFDYQMGAHTTLAGSYTYDNASSLTPDVLDEKYVGVESRNQRVMLSLQHVFSPTVINTLRTGFSRQVAAEALDTMPQTPLVSNTTLSFVPGMPVGIINVPSLASPGGIGSDGANQYWYTTPQFNDDLGWQKGRNNFRFGFSVDAIRENLNGAGTPNGTWTFGSIHDFLTDVPQQFTSDFPGTSTYRGIRTKLFGAYIQDDLRMKSNLTVNLGLRYEPATVISEVQGKFGNLKNITDPTPTVGNPLYANPSLRNFEPRIGLAWDPFGTGKTSVRSGFGVFDILPLPNTVNLKIVRTAPFYEAGSVLNPPPSSFPSGAFNLETQNTLQAIYIEPHPHAAYKLQWNLNIQQQVTKDMAVTIGYVGSRGVHLPLSISDIDQVPPSLVTVLPNGVLQFPTTGTVQRINPNFSRIMAEEWEGYSFYHSLQSQVVQQLHHGFTFQAVYVWSKSIDDGTTEYSTSDYANSMDMAWAFEPSLNRGVSDFDVTHHFSANLLWNVPSLRLNMAVAKFFVSGWQVGGIFTAQTGDPFSIRLTTDQARVGGSAGGLATASERQRPNFVPGPNCPSENAINPGNFNNYVNLQCFSFPPLGQLGNLGRNTLRGPGLEDFDFSVFKNDNLWGEKLRMQFRAEFFNVFNRSNLSELSVTGFDSQGQPIPVNTQLAPPTVTTSRQIQFAMKFIW